jgi:hypothetical protein
VANRADADGVMMSERPWHIDGAPNTGGGYWRPNVRTLRMFDMWAAAASTTYHDQEVGTMSHFLVQDDVLKQNVEKSPDCCIPESGSVQCKQSCLVCI